MRIKVVLMVSIFSVATTNCAKHMEFVSSIPAVSTSSVDVVGSETVCDALSGGTMRCAPNQGLRGSIYILSPEEGQRPENFRVDSYIQFGAKLPVQIQLSHLDVLPRDFTAGFPLSDGSLLSDSAGNPVLEYFGLDVSGYFELKAPYASGEYEFAELADDGSVFLMDGKIIVDDDGTHPPMWACSQPIHLKVGEKRSVQLKYYQGPRTAIALNVYFRQAKHDGICDETGGWTVLPPDMLSN
jgi:hypothetical protein